jgi:hypothetical protein
VGVIFYTIARISPEDNVRILNICNRTGLPVVMLSEVLNLLHHHLTRSSGPAHGEETSAEPLVMDQPIENLNA